MKKRPVPKAKGVTPLTTPDATGLAGTFESSFDGKPSRNTSRTALTAGLEPPFGRRSPGAMTRRKNSASLERTVWYRRPARAAAPALRACINRRGAMWWPGVQVPARFGASLSPSAGTVPRRRCAVRCSFVAVANGPCTVGRSAPPVRGIGRVALALPRNLREGGAGRPRADVELTVWPWSVLSPVVERPPRGLRDPLPSAMFDGAFRATTALCLRFFATCVPPMRAHGISFTMNGPRSNV